MTVAFPAPTNPVAVDAGPTPTAQPPNKLAKAAQEFESILLTSWLEKMNQGLVGSEESQDPAHDTVSSLGTQAIASALAARGGIGIARLLLRQLQPAKTVVTEQSASANLPPAAAGKILRKD
jgi:Rod binding domain-containing protein